MQEFVNSSDNKEVIQANESHKYKYSLETVKEWL